MTTEALRRTSQTQGDDERSALAIRAERYALVGTTLLPAPLILYLGLNAGGFSRGITGVAATVLAVLFAVRALVAPRTVRRPGVVGLLGAGALLGLALWQLLSVTWSDSAWRAIAEVDRTALYLIVCVTFVTLPRQRLQPVLVSAGGAILLLALIGLATRLRPDLFPTELGSSPQRLSYPLSYWNAMGVFIAIGMVLCLHAAADASWPRLLRIGGAAALPPLAVTLYLTQSRGGIGAAVAGLVVYCVLGRPRSLVLALVAAGVPTYLAVKGAYGAEALVSRTPTSGEAVAQGKDLLNEVLIASAVAALVRALVSPLDVPLARMPLPALGRSGRVAAWGAVAALAAVGAGALISTGEVERQYDRFVRNAPTNPSADPRARLTEVYNSNRLSHWDVALDASADRRWTGTGAGTFDLQWQRYRKIPNNVTEAHSLYVEILGELGVVGLVLVVVLLASLVGGALSRWYRRPAAAAVVAVIAAWALHAALDWDWEVPAVTVVPIALAAAAAAVPARASRGRWRWTPFVAGAGVVMLAILPALTALYETRLDESLRSYTDGDCAAATRTAERARSLLPMQPEPHAVLALCALRADEPAAATRLSRRAVETDPNDWEWRYLNALVIGATGGNPRGELTTAARFNPLGVPPAALARVLRETPRPLWPVRAGQAFVWMHGKAYPAIRR